MKLVKENYFRNSKATIHACKITGGRRAVEDERGSWMWSEDLAARTMDKGAETKELCPFGIYR